MMFNTLSTLLLIPVLLPQGIWVRMTTPRLPEAEGPRFGSIGSGPTIKVLILGDSAAAGVGVESQSQALSGQLVARLAKRYTVNWRLEANTGDKTQDVLTRLATMDAESFDVVITSIGVNDVTSSVQPQEWKQQQSALVRTLRTKFSANRILMTVVPPMNAFPALPQPLRWCLGHRAYELNVQLATLVKEHSWCELVEPGFELDSALMASDGFHPGPELYKQWAETLARCITGDKSFG